MTSLTETHLPANRQVGSFYLGRSGSFLPGQLTRWFCKAIATASVRLDTFSLERMLLT
jgi:hypothetical protein